MKNKARIAGFLVHAFSRTPAGPLFNVDGDGGGGGGVPGGGVPGGEPPRTFTQADLDRIVGQRVGEATKKFAGFDELKGKAEKAAEYEAELAKLREEKENAGKTAEERERIAATKAAAVMERERQDLMTKITAAEARAESAEKRRRDLIVDGGLGAALDGANVLAKARADAVDAFRNHSKVELDDDDGRILTVTYGGVAYKTAAEAALAFLKEKDHFASGRIVGGNSQPPNGGSAQQNFQNVSSESLISQGLSARTRR
jgi:hypothetical protein